MGRKYTLGMAVRQLKNKLSVSWRAKVRRFKAENVLLILTEPRSGSNLLLDYLSSHPDVAVTEEVLNPWAAIGFPRGALFEPFALNHVRDSLALPAKVAVCKLMLHHLRYFNISFDRLSKVFPQARIVVLYREHLLEQYVSMQRMMLTGVHKRQLGTETNQRLADPKITVDLGAFRAWALKHKNRFREVLQSELAPQIIGIYSYEELVRAPGATLKQIFVAVGVDSVEINTRMAKQNQEALHDAVANYELIRASLTSTEQRMHLSLLTADNEFPNGPPAL